MNRRRARQTEDAVRVLAARSPLWFRSFAHLFGRALRSDFHALRVSKAGPALAGDLPHLVVYSNHPSWWDAVVYMIVAERLFPGRTIYAPIDEAMLSKYGFMRRIGAFGVVQGRKAGASTFLTVAQQIMTRADGAMFITAQGRFADVRERPVRLAAGLSHLATQLPFVTFIPMAIEYAFWNERKPEALLRFGSPFRIEPSSGRGAIQQELANRLEQEMDALSREAAARAPEAFSVLMGGREGVGGVYDFWRRLRAASRGERFTPAHGRPD